MPTVNLTAEQIAELVAKGLIPADAAKAPPRGKSRGKGKAPFVAPSFTAPGTWTIPVLVKPGNNARGRWAKIGRSGNEKRAVYRTLARWLRELAPFADAAQAGKPVRCVLTRLGVGTCDDDGLHDAMKYVRDAVSDFLGVDDGPTGPVRWVVNQERADAVGVRIRLEVVHA